MSGPAKTTSLRHAADTAFHFKVAAKAAKRTEETAQDPQAIELARKLKEASLRLHRHAAQLERICVR